MIAPHILAISIVMSLLWGRYLVTKAAGYTYHHDARSLTEVLVAIVPFAISSAYLVRTATVLLGFGDGLAGQLSFFALLAPTILVGIWVNLPDRWRL